MRGLGNIVVRTLFAVGAALLALWPALLPAEASAKTPAAEERAFRQFILSLWPPAERHGVTRATFDAALLPP